MRPIEHFLPRYDVREAHAISMAGSTDAVYRAIREIEFSQSAVIRRLFRLRGLPPAALRLEGLLSSGFILLEDSPGRHLVLGLVGRFWRPAGQLMVVAPHAFKTTTPAGCAKAAWDFEIRELSPGVVRLSTETRVFCPDGHSRRRFRLYWRLIGPFSAWIRREMLRAVKAHVAADPLPPKQNPPDKRLPQAAPPCVRPRSGA